MLLVMSGNIVVFKVVNAEKCINGHKKLDCYDGGNNVYLYERNF